MGVPGPSISRKPKKPVAGRGARVSLSDHDIISCPELEPPEGRAGASKIGSRLEREPVHRIKRDVSGKVGTNSQQLEKSRGSSQRSTKHIGAVQPMTGRIWGAGR